MMISKEQKQDIERALSHVYGDVKLRCDGYEVSLQVQRCKGLSFKVMTYVNGSFKGVWCFPQDGDDYPERKFLRKKITYLYKKAEQQKLIKRLGKKRANELFNFDKHVVGYMPDWLSGKTAINHLLKVCDSVELIKAL